MSWVVLIACLFPQDPLEELKKEIELLKKDNAELRERLNVLEKQSADDARHILRLRQALRAYEPAAPAEAPPAVPDAKPSAPAGDSGPLKPIRAKVDFVNAELGFLLINKGERDGVRTGYRFEIVRETFDGPNASSRYTPLGVAEFEKYMGNDQGTSKLKIVEGKASEMRFGDEAVAYRKMEPRPVTSAGAPADLAKAPGVYHITGTAGKGFVITYGSVDGARQTDIVLVYRDGKLKAKLRLDRVEKNYSVGNVIDGSLIEPPEIEDQVLLQEIKKSVVGKIRRIDEKNGAFVDVGQNNLNVKPGQVLEVRRQGQRIGTIRLVQVEKFWSWARAEGETKPEDIQIGDLVELLAEK